LGRVDLVSHEPAYQDLLREHENALVGDPVTIPLSAGDATVHDGLTIHGAGENHSDDVRVGWALVFIPADALWTGLSHPHANMRDLGMQPGETFDHPRFRPPQVA
jgi:ectoine hydroxylase-related dioxygenase (phytanoyl-CoA dioxygenase family)